MKQRRLTSNLWADSCALKQTLSMISLALVLLLSGCLGGGQIFLSDDPNKTLCASDSDCASSEICQAQVCESRTPSCETQADCPEGLSCSGQLCLKPGACYADPQCPESHRCEDFRCVPDRCQSNADCNNGEVCDLTFGMCQAPRCNTDQDCPGSGCCSPFNGQCAPQSFCEELAQSIPPQCEPSPELCDGIDNDCDGAIDEDFNELGQSCGVGEGLCFRLGHQQCLIDGSSVACDAVPGPTQLEVCDGVDNDCDGETDENC